MPRPGSQASRLSRLDQRATPGSGDVVAPELFQVEAEPRVDDLANLLEGRHLDVDAVALRKLV